MDTFDVESYTVTNVTLTYELYCRSTTLNIIADVLGTLLAAGENDVVHTWDLVEIEDGGPKVFEILELKVGGVIGAGGGVSVTLVTQRDVVDDEDVVTINVT
jgi:hypothetical protein